MLLSVTDENAHADELDYADPFQFTNDPNYEDPLQFEESQIHLTKVRILRRRFPNISQH